ncbi:MAG: DUF2520 domain-containing protein [Flavobacteriaceae bacterium]|nr:DUF2520 domain-containing protein [Flavobacteriaceae bacterium]
MIKIIILGAGNVGTHLFRNLNSSKQTKVVQWYNRSLDSINKHKKEVAVTNQIKDLREADVYLLALSDDVIPEMAKQLKDLKGIIAHTAGSVPMSILSESNNYGVFYPLQTFSKNRDTDFKNIPICLEASNESSYQTLFKLASTLGNNINKINSEQRLGLHTAAVFVNNFTNHLYQLGNTICKEQNISFRLLQPLIKETAAKIESMTPKDAQTGPALRKDYITLQKHQDQLSNPDIKNLYLYFTESIQKKQ